MTFARLCLKAGAGSPAGAVRAGAGREVGDDRGRLLACAGCLQPVTTSAARIQVGGAHEHRFTNPHGFRFHIGCFSTAAGCSATSEPSTAFTWFPGYAWRVEACSRCGAHLGWLFGSAERSFHGLILDRLAEQEA